MWHVVDPMAETQSSYTPYHYCYNNPVNLVDPLGLDPNGNLWNWFMNLFYNSDRFTQKGKKSRGSRGGGSGPGGTESSSWSESDDNFGNVNVGAQNSGFDDWVKKTDAEVRAYIFGESSVAGITATLTSFIKTLLKNAHSYNSF